MFLNTINKKISTVVLLPAFLFFFITTSANAITTIGLNIDTGGTLTVTGNISGGTFNGNTITTGTGILTLGAGKTLTISNTLTLAGTDSSTLNIGTGGTLGTAAYTAATAYQAVNTSLTSLAGLTYVSPSFVKMTGAGTFALDTNTYLTSLSGAVLTDQTAGQTIGLTGARLTKLWATDITLTNALVGSVTGNAGTVTNATLTTALTVNTGTVTLTGNVANTSVLTIGAGAVSVSGANTGDQTITLTGGVTGSGTGSFATTVVTNANLTGDVTSVGNASTVVKINGTLMSGLATGILKNTTTTGVPSIAVAGDFPTLNQNTTGTAAGLSATLAIASGGTGQTTALAAFNALSPVTTLGDIIFRDATNNVRLAGNTTATKNFLVQTGTGTVSAAPVWGTITAADVPTLNQSTTGSAATLTTPRAIYGNNFDGSAALTGIIASTYGGTGNGFTKFSGPTTAEKTFTLPDASATIATIDATQTLTNKRTNPRIISAASYTTDTGSSLDVSTADQFIVTAQAGALLFNAPGGTPVEGQKLIIRIKDNGTAGALTYNAVFRAMGVALPTTTVISKTLYMGFIYNITDTKWDLVAVAQEA